MGVHYSAWVEVRGHLARVIFTTTTKAPGGAQVIRLGANTFTVWAILLAQMLALPGGGAC